MGCCEERNHADAGGGGGIGAVEVVVVVVGDVEGVVLMVELGDDKDVDAEAIVISSLQEEPSGHVKGHGRSLPITLFFDQ